MYWKSLEDMLDVVVRPMLDGVCRLRHASSRPSTGLERGCSASAVGGMVPHGAALSEPAERLRGMPAERICGCNHGHGHGRGCNLTIAATVTPSSRPSQPAIVATA